MKNDGNAILALGAEHMVRLTGLNSRQLAYWDKTGFFKPEFAAENRRSHHARVYSFRDAVDLRTIGKLLNEHRVPLAHLKQVAKKLSGYTDRPWSRLKLSVFNRRVQFIEPDTGAVRDVMDGQYVLLPLIDVIHEVETALEDVKRRDPTMIGRFERRRHVVRNSLVVAGTRVPVSAILAYVDDGYATADILREFPLLTAQDIDAVRRLGRAALAA